MKSSQLILKYFSRFQGHGCFNLPTITHSEIHLLADYYQTTDIDLLNDQLYRVECFVVIFEFVLIIYSRNKLPI